MTLTTITSGRARKASLAAATLACSIAVAACGGSSSGSASAATTSASKAASSSTRASFVACLKQHGFTPPAGAGNGGPGGGTGNAGPGGGTGTHPSPAAAGNSKLKTAFAECGGPGHRPSGSGG